MRGGNAYSVVLHFGYLKAYINTSSGWFCRPTLNSLLDRVRLVTQPVPVKHFTTKFNDKDAGLQGNVAGKTLLLILFYVYIQCWVKPTHNISASGNRFTTIIPRKCIFYSWLRSIFVTFLTSIQYKQPGYNRSPFDWEFKTIQLCHIAVSCFIQKINLF